MLKNKIHIGVFTPKWGKVKLKRHSHILVLLTLVFNTKCQLHLIFHKRITHSFVCKLLVYQTPHTFTVPQSSYTTTILAASQPNCPELRNSHKSQPRWTVARSKRLTLYEHRIKLHFSVILRLANIWCYSITMRLNDELFC